MLVAVQTCNSVGLHSDPRQKGGVENKTTHGRTTDCDIVLMGSEIGQGAMSGRAAGAT